MSHTDPAAPRSLPSPKRDELSTPAVGPSGQRTEAAAPQVDAARALLQPQDDVQPASSPVVALIRADFSTLAALSLPPQDEPDDE